MKRIVKIEDSSNYNIVGKRINHLSNLFLKKVRRKYENSGLKNRENWGKMILYQIIIEHLIGSVGIQNIDQ